MISDRDKDEDIPSEWVQVKLGDVLQVIRGASPRPKGDPRYFGGDIPWIKISDITKEKGKHISITKDHVTEDGAQKSRFLQAGTLILSNSGTVCVPKILAVDGCIHDGFVAFPELPDKFDILYLYYFFDKIRPQIINENRQGITQVNLNTTIVFNPVPIINKIKILLFPAAKYWYIVCRGGNPIVNGIPARERIEKMKTAPAIGFSCTIFPKL